MKRKEKFLKRKKLEPGRENLKRESPKRKERTGNGRAWKSLETEREDLKRKSVESEREPLKRTEDLKRKEKSLKRKRFETGREDLKQNSLETERDAFETEENT